MARIKTDSTELVTDKSLQQIANGIRGCIIRKRWIVLRIKTF